MKRILPILVILLLFVAFVPPVLAAKIQKVAVSTYRTPRDIRATFSNFKNAKKISYQLTYKRAGGINDGVGGIVFPKGKSVTKIMTLGSCSTGNICTYHKGITNIKLKVTVWYSPSLTVETKTYTIK